MSKIDRAYTVLQWIILALAITILIVGIVKTDTVLILLGVVFILDWISDRL